MDLDVILHEIGEFGKFQFTNYILLCLPVFYCAANSLSYVFTAKKSNYRCFVPQCDDAKTPHYGDDWVKDILPGKISKSTGHFVPDECSKYSFINETFTLQNQTCLPNSFDHKKLRCNRWVFDEHERTIINDWPDELSCEENEWKLALVGSIHYAGIIVGTGSFGFIADVYGRKKIFIISIIFMSLTGIAQAASSSYLWFMIFAFLNAVGTSGVYPLAFVLGVEMVGKERRELAGVVLNYFYSIGEALVGIIAWISSDWISLQYWVSAPPILFIVYYWIIPESARWLLAKKRNLEAYEIIKKAAKINGVQLSQNSITQLEQEVNKNVSETDKESPETDSATYIGLLKSKTLMLRSLILFLIWGTNAFVFYGLSLNAINLSGNIYFNFIIGCLIEIPGNTIAWIVINKFGRKLSLSCSLLACGITCIVGGFIPQKIFWIQICMFLVGKMAITSSFTIIFVYTAEMMPTLIRSGTVGTFSTMARFFSLAAPFIPLLAKFHDFLPLFVFGAFAFTSGILALFLPETLGIKLPDTITEAEDIGKSSEESTLHDERTHL